MYEKDSASILGSRNPKELNAVVIPLFPCEGKVHSVQSFMGANATSLQEHEQGFVLEFINELTTEAKIPSSLNRCLSRSEDIVSSNRSALFVKRNGARSAYWEKENIKFKGCRPITDTSTYPIEHLPFGETKIICSKIPFGVLSKESILREILGYCFFKKHRIPSIHTPICVYEYINDGITLGYCMVSKTKGEDRVENYIEYPDVTLKDIVNTDKLKKKIGYNILGKELNVRVLNLWWYVEEKSEILTRMHFNGGFRGILNSNIGNDIIVRENQKFELYICDLDTFRVIDFSRSQDTDFLNHFFLHCLIEVVKSSISIFDYIDVPEDADFKERNRLLSKVYFEKSSVWKAYKRKFLKAAKGKDWNSSQVEDAIQFALMTEAFADVISQRVLNSYYLKHMIKKRGIYYPHN